MEGEEVMVVLLISKVLEALLEIGGTLVVIAIERLVNKWLTKSI
jgi:hypothetical protein